MNNSMHLCLSCHTEMSKSSGTYCTLVGTGNSVLCVMEELGCKTVQQTLYLKMVGTYIANCNAKKQKQKTATKARQSKMSFLRAAHAPHVSMLYKYPAREKGFLPVYCHNNGMWHLLVV